VSTPAERLRRRRRRFVGALGAVGACVLAYVGAGVLAPSGLPAGVALQGLVLGALDALGAAGLVLVFRTQRVVNFAQAEIGGLGAAVAVVLVAGVGLPYAVAAPVGLAVAAATGALVERTVVARLYAAPRLTLTVATIGVAELLGAAAIALPAVAPSLAPLSSFRAPVPVRFRLGPIAFGGDHVLVLAATPVIVAGLALFLLRSDLGVALRGAADAPERAALLGIPVRRCSLVAWTLAGGLSGAAAILAAPILGPRLGVPAGATALLGPLAAAVLAGMERLPTAVLASAAIGVLDQAVSFATGHAADVDVALFGVVLAGLVIERRRHPRTAHDREGLGALGAGATGDVAPVRPLPPSLATLDPIRRVRRAGTAALVAAAAALPLVASGAQVTAASFVAIYAIVAASLVVLTGWSGQVSLGQFALVGIGASTTAALLVHAHADLFVALLASGAVAGAAAVAVGLPAARLPGPFLAVATLAFAVPVSSYLLSSTHFPLLTPPSLVRPAIFGRFGLDAPPTFYELCLGVLVVALLSTRNLRRSRPGRAILAVRDSERQAASFSIRPSRARLVAFGWSGALAGVAGGLYAVGLRGIGFAGFDPEKSLEVFAMVVVGGLGSLAGGVLGAVYVEGAQDLLHGASVLLGTGAGMLAALLLVPEGLGGLLYRARDALVQRLARAGPAPAEAVRDAGSVGEVERGALPPAFSATLPVTGTSGGRDRRRAPVSPGPSSGPVLEVDGLRAGYGRLEVLRGVGFAMAPGEVVALLGTNGAGKSTVLGAIAGLLPAASGTVRYAGQDLRGLDAAARAAKGLVAVFGGRGVFPSLTVEENLRLGGWLCRRDPATRRRRREEALAQFPDLAARLEATADALSGGQRQMLALAQALELDPRALLVDELTLGLDPAALERAIALVRGLSAAGVAVLVAEQSLAVAARLATRAVFLERGTVRFDGPVGELARRDDLLRPRLLAAAGGGRARGGQRPVGAHAPRSEARGRAAGEEALRLAGVEVAFGGVQALCGVDLVLGSGEVLGIVGANGAGKTTLLDVCSGFTSPDHGRVELLGADVTGLDAPRRAALGLGRVFQDSRLFPSLTVREALAVALERHVEVREPLASVFRLRAVVASEAKVGARVDELLERFRLAGVADRFTTELSTGTRRVLELACLCAHDPAVVLLDEPSAGLAEPERVELASLLAEVRATTRASLLVVEHDLRFVGALADRLACLHLGRVVAEGPPDEVLANPTVAQALLDAAPEASAGTPRGWQAARPDP
jgi:branched-chain amino acid transport system permease protein